MPLHEALNPRTTTDREQRREAARALARVRRDVGWIRGLATTFLLLVVATLVFVWKLQRASDARGFLGGLLVALLVTNLVLLAVHAFALWRAPRSPLLAAALMAGLEAVGLALFLPAIPLALVFPALLAIFAFRGVGVVLAFGLVLRGRAAEAALEAHPELDATRNAALVARAEGAAHRAAERRAAAARRGRWSSALRIGAIGSVLGGALAGVLWLTSPVRDFPPIGEEFVAAWNEDVLAIGERWPSVAARAEWPATVEHMGWNRSAPKLRAGWSLERLDRDLLLSTHATEAGDEIEARWRLDGAWTFQSAGAPLGPTVARFRERWNARDLEALPWFFGRPGPAAIVLQRLLDDRGWRTDFPRLGEPREEPSLDERRVFTFELAGERLRTKWRFVDGRWRLTGFAPPSR